MALGFEIAATVFGLVQSILILFNRRENWIFYMLNILTLTIFSFTAKLYGDVLENSVYIIIGILGLFTWYSDKIETNLLSKYGGKIRYCTNKERVIYGISLVVVSIMCYFWLSYTNDPMPFLDAITTGMGLVATLMMAFKKIDAWVIWFVDDILMALIYFSLPDKALYLMALNILWIFLAIGTYMNWVKVYKKEKEQETT